jgi:DNA-binding CsgD family transcriptional regulator
MSASRPTDDARPFDAGRQVTHWRAREERLRQIGRAGGQCDDPEAAAHLLRMLRDERDKAQLHLLQGWGFNTLTFPPTIIALKGHKPNRFHDPDFFPALGQFLLHQDACIAVEDVIAREPVERRYSAAARAVLDVARLVPRMEALAYRTLSDLPGDEAPLLREALAMNLAGWVGSTMSVSTKWPHTRRLAGVLEAEARRLGMPREALFLEHLPAEGLAAVQEEPADDDWDPQRIINRVSDRLAQWGVAPEGSDPAVSTAFEELTDRASGFAAEQEFWAEEAAASARADAEELIERARLAPRERQVFDLDQQGRAGKEIGGILGITEGAVKSTLFRVRQKLDRAAGSH